MGRTLPSATVVFMQEEAAFARFRRALRRADQLALDDLFVSARQHLAAAQYASHALPFEVFLLSMLLEEHKEVMKLRERVEALSTTHPTGIPWGDEVLTLPPPGRTPGRCSGTFPFGDDVGGDDVPSGDDTAKSASTRPRLVDTQKT